MLQYIINSTAIWLFGLLVFDLFLRNEAQHSYNRLYLLSVLIAGTVIPFWSWDYDSVIYTTNMGAPIAKQSATVKETIVNASQPTVIEWQQWLMIIYYCGVGLFFLLLVKDVVNIIRLYRRGTKSKDGTWTIIETGENQSPFSAFRYIFISGKENYSESELQMILAHEEQHGHLLHFIDVLITRITAITFWFNPLVYLIENRLLMVHEYQADVAVKNNPATYGQFLIEQSVLGSAPVLAHSFIRSPLKKRILMLTKKTTAIAKGKQVLIIPVLLVSMLCFTQNAFSWGAPQRDGTKVTYRGNVIEYNDVDTSTDTSQAVDPSTGKNVMVISRREPTPNKINGEIIYNQYTIRTPGNYGGDVSSMSNFKGQALKVYLLTNMAKEIKKLSDGKYQFRIGDIIIDKEGKIAFYQFQGISKQLDKAVNGSRIQDIDKVLQDKFARKISTLIDNMPAYKPSDIDGKPVNSSGEGIWSYFTVKDGKLVAL